MSDLRNKIADTLYGGGAQADYADYLEKAEEIIEVIGTSMIYQNAYRAGWNDALRKLRDGAENPIVDALNSAANSMLLD